MSLPHRSAPASLIAGVVVAITACAATAASAPPPTAVAHRHAPRGAAA
jgi:hypothetical protein